jgi:hypothetical protein
MWEKCLDIGRDVEICDSFVEVMFLIMMFLRKAQGDVIAQGGIPV